MQKYKPVILFVVLVMTIFLLPNFAKAQNSDIVINEICPKGCASNKEKQWIEIYNKGSEMVNIEGWEFYVKDESLHKINTTTLSINFIIEPGDYAVIARDENIFLDEFPGFDGRLYQSSWTNSLSQDGDFIGLKDAIDGWVETEFFYPAVTNFSLQRRDPFVSSSDSTNWCGHESDNTVGTVSVCSEIVETTTSTSTSTPDIDQTSDSDNQTPTTTIELKINEFYPYPNSGEEEWIEIYNPTASSVDLTGWKIYDSDNHLIASPTSTILAGDFLVVTSSKLNNTGGDSVILKDPNGVGVDSASYTSVAKSNSIARSVDGVGSFVETTTPTKGAPNFISVPIAQQTNSGGGGGSSNPVLSVIFNSSDIVINEIVSDPSDGLVEFIELYNNTNSLIDLSNWWLEDGSESKTSLAGSIASHGFKIIESPSGNLNNSGDLIILFSSGEKEIDRLTYGTWDDGNTSDNASAPEDSLSLIRKVDGQDSNNDYYDFVLTSTITKGSSNVISAITEAGEIVEQLLSTAKIKINEIMPNPAGSDTENEFIELKNEGTETINLQNWGLGDSTGTKYKITQGTISPNSYIVFKRSMTKIALNNTGGDEVKLYSANGSLVDSIKYSGSAHEDQSYARKDDDTWSWTTKTTPNLKNIIEGNSSAPVISIDVDTEVAVGEPVMFDASDTTDPENELMIFEWNFNDGIIDDGLVVEHVFANEGVYNVKLKVTDASWNFAEKQVIITVKNILDFVGGYFESGYISNVKITEFIPNPTGSDTTEFVELYNYGSEDVDLSGMKLDDEEGGSRAYTFPNGTVIVAGEYFVVGRQDSKLALNNTSDSIRLIYPDGTILQEVRYDDVPEGASYALDNSSGVWGWTGTVTPGEENIISNVRTTNNTNIRTVARSNTIKPVINTSLEKLRDEDVGDQVKVTGVVAVEPGVLGSQYFYIVGSSPDAKSRQAGVQVYMYKKDFPILKIGDEIEIVGEISEAYGETRVKLSAKGDIKIIDHLDDPTPIFLNIEDLQEPYEGWLVQVNGEITESKSSYMYVDDGTEEIKVYFKRGAGINNKVLQVGDLVNVTGLLAQTSSGYQLLPRAQIDIEKTGVAESFVKTIKNETEEEKKETTEKYLTATAGGLTSILIGLFAKARGAWAIGFAKRMTGVAVAVVKRRRG